MKKLSIFQESISSINGCYCIDCFHVAGHPCKLQFDRCVNFMAICQGCLGMPKVFRNNEYLISQLTF